MLGTRIQLAALSVQTAIVSAATKAYAVVQAILNSAFLASPITWIVIGIIALVAAIVLIATKTTWFQDIWAAAWGGIKDAAAAVWDWLSGAATAVFQFIATVIKAYINIYIAIFNGLVAGVEAVLELDPERGRNRPRGHLRDHPWLHLDLRLDLRGDRLRGRAGPGTP